MPDNTGKRRYNPVSEDALKKWADMMRDSSTDLAHKMALVAFDMDTLKSPEDAIAERIRAAQDFKPGDYGFVDFSATNATREALIKQLERYERAYFASLVKEVAEKTGADPEEIADKNRRTPEQQRALVEASARRQLDRIDSFFESDYMKAVRALDDISSVLDKDSTQRDEDGYSFKESFLLYYFTTRPDIRPSTTGKFTQADKESLIEQFKRFEEFAIEYFGNAEKAEKAVDVDFIRALQAFIEKENPADAEEIIEHLTSVLPQKYVVPNNKLANTMTKGIIDIGRITLEESRRGAKKLVETTCILTYEGDNVHLSGRQSFTEYDRNVYNAVSSLFVYGDPSHVVTPAMVYRAMTGLTDTEKPTAGQLAAVTRSLDKMRFIRAQIDCTEELKARRITLNSKQINSGEIDTNLLMAKWIKVRAGGQKVKAMKIVDVPILYEYAAAVKQVLTLPASVLDIREVNPDGSLGARLPNTESRILIKGCLIRRIEGMKGKNGLSNPVISLYDYERDGETHQGLYSIAGKADAKDLEAKRIRTDVEKMLAYWQATGYIKAFEAQTQRRKITGYKITV